MVLPSIQCVFVALSKDVILPNCFTDICCHNRQSFANDTKLIGRACTSFPGLANRAGEDSDRQLNKIKIFQCFECTYSLIQNTDLRWNRKNIGAS